MQAKAKQLWRLLKKWLLQSDFLKLILQDGTYISSF